MYEMASIPHSSSTLKYSLLGADCGSGLRSGCPITKIKGQRITDNQSLSLCSWARQSTQIASYKCEWMLHGGQRGCLVHIDCHTSTNLPYRTAVATNVAYHIIHYALVWMNNDFNVEGFGSLKSSIFIQSITILSTWDFTANVREQPCWLWETRKL